MKMNIALIVIGIVLIVVGIVRMVADRPAPEPQEYDYIGFRESEPTPQAAAPVTSAPVAAPEPAPAASAPAVAQAPAEPVAQPQAAPQPAAEPAETQDEWAKRVGNEFENFVANFFRQP